MKLHRADRAAIVKARGLTAFEARLVEFLSGSVHFLGGIDSFATKGTRRRCLRRSPERQLLDGLVVG